jgi:plastocyanin
MPSRPTSWGSIKLWKRRSGSTPGLAPRRPGVVVWGIAAASLVGCEAVGGGATIQLDTAEVQLGRGASVHEVVLGGAADQDSITPARLTARPGDAIRFVTADHRMHAVAFDAERLDPVIRDYLHQANQLRGPPLVNEGGAWVVVLDGAPPGAYPFVCRPHGTRGLLVVEPGE